MHQREVQRPETQFVGAIHGRLLTAWSTAGIVGPVVVNYLHDIRLEQNIPFDQIYGPIFLIPASMLLIGFIANLLIRPVADKWFMTEQELQVDQRVAPQAALPEDASVVSGNTGVSLSVVPAWTAVGIALAWGTWITVTKALPL